MTNGEMQVWVDAMEHVSDLFAQAAEHAEDGVQVVEYEALLVGLPPEVVHEIMSHLLNGQEVMAMPMRQAKTYLTGFVQGLLYGYGLHETMKTRGSENSSTS